MPIWHRMASRLQLPARHLLGRASANTKYRDSVAPANYVLAYGRRGAYRTEHHHRGAAPGGIVIFPRSRGCIRPARPRQVNGRLSEAMLLR